MLFRELNRGTCKTYLVACEKTRRSALVDPVKERTDRYLAVLAYEGLRLDFAIETHTHADHRTGSFELADLTSAKIIMHRKAPQPRVHVHVEDNEDIEIGEIRARVLATPGHTPDGLSLHVEDRVLTGDTLLVGGTGRSDFAGGDPGEEYDSITQRLFALPDETLVFPAHDYRGHTHSTIGEEKRSNPRVAGRTREEYVRLMNGLGLALPDKIQEVLQPNQAAIEDDRVHFPSLAELNEVRQLAPEEVIAALRGSSPPLLVDVREPEEYSGELGHVAGSLLLPLPALADRAGELGSPNAPIVVICRAGVRSTTGAAILTGLGFDHVSNLKGGMIEWNDRGLPIER